MSDTAITPAAPEWFSRAIACQPESRFADIDGAPVHYLSWNAHEVHKPALLFAHGFRAHARWWSFVAPFFVSRFRLFALDFSGMGDSGHREHYDQAQFARDIVGVIEHGGLGKTTLVGHSFGGRQVLRTCADYADHVERAVVLDSFVPLVGGDPRIPPPMEVRPKKIYPNYAAARARFRLVPEQNCATAYVLDYVARHSMGQVIGPTGDGWTWKFDANYLPLHMQSDGVESEALLPRIAVPVTLVYGDLSSVLSRTQAHAIVERLPHGRGPVAIPQSHHHVMLDQPLSLVAALKAILY